MANALIHTITISTIFIIANLVTLDIVLDTTLKITP